jgi:hypothetical protein
MMRLCGRVSFAKKKTGIPILGYGKVEDLFKLKEKGEGHA